LDVLPIILQLRNEIQKKHQCKNKIRAGAVRELETPASATFAVGARAKTLYKSYNR
jgi:hypothetical protein